MKQTSVKGIKYMEHIRNLLVSIYLKLTKTMNTFYEKTKQKP